MMKKYSTLAIVLILSPFVFISTLYAGTYSGGTGEPNNPYQIADANDWQELMVTSGDWDKYFLLAADVNLAGVNLTPVGNGSIIFTGAFDGNGHVICNAVINQPSNGDMGIFGDIRDGQIRNLGVEDVNIIGSGGVGGLVGANGGTNGLITSCYATGTVSGTSSAAGGLVGRNTGRIALCYSSASVYGISHVGGLVGSNGGSIASCHSTGNVSGGYHVGGLVGGNGGKYGSIISCYAIGPVGGIDNVGGLVGINGSSITSCCSTGNVSGTSNEVGGLVGENGGSITSCYSTGSVSAGNDVGGLVGYNTYGGSITSCYSIGNVDGTNLVGGLVGITGEMDSIIIFCFWDVQTSGQTTSAGGTGKTTAEMKTKSTFTDAGWDFVNVWKMKDHLEYPHLIWENASPVACIADANQPIEAQGSFGAKVTLDGSCSSDADSTQGTNDDINDFDWYRVDPCNPMNEIYIGSGQILDCNLPLGQHTIVLEVTDKAGATDSSEITITIEDTTPPDLNLPAIPKILWPPNRQMITIPPCTATDLCDPAPDISLTVTMNEPGDAADIQILKGGSVLLRATRSGNNKTGRIYTLTYKACDASRNCTTKTATITVPHDNRK